MNKKYEFYYEGHIEEWFKENYFIFDFDFIMPFWPGDYLAIKDNAPIIIELELNSSGVWLHKFAQRKYFDYLICFHIYDIDKIRLEGAKMKYFSIEEYLEDDLIQQRLNELIKRMGIKKLPW